MSLSPQPPSLRNFIGQLFLVTHNDDVMFRYLGDPLLSLSLQLIKGSKLWEASSFPYQTSYQAIENNNYIPLFLNKSIFLTLILILVGMGMFSLIPFVLSLKSLQKRAILTPF